MGNCNTCNCDGKGEATPNEFNMDVRYSRYLTIYKGLSEVFESI